MDRMTTRAMLLQGAPPNKRRFGNRVPESDTPCARVSLLIRYVWALPNTLIGLLLVPAAMLPRGRMVDEHAPNPQYRLVFEPRDAQCESDRRETWAVASAAKIGQWKAAMHRADELARPIFALASSDPEAFERWRSRCEESPIWQGIAASSAEPPH